MNTPVFSHRIQLLFWALFSLLLGAGFIFFGFTVFGYLVSALPWILGIGAIFIFLNFLTKGDGKKKYFGISLSLIIFAGAAILFRWAYLRDAVLWYIFVGYLIISAYSNIHPIWQRGLEKHSFIRVIGSLTVWGFAALLLFMPRAGLSDALQLLGVFAAAWGVYQLLLPPCSE